jgi:hypothetical protein
MKFAALPSAEEQPDLRGNRLADGTEGDSKAEGTTRDAANVYFRLLPGHCAREAEVDWTVVDRRPYLVCHDVHLAFDDYGTVMLHRGLYKIFGVREQKALALGVQAWPRNGSEGTLSAGQSEFLKRLVAQGVLTQDLRLGVPASVVSVDSPVGSLLDHDLDWSRPAITGTHVRRFCVAMLMGRFRELRHHLEGIAEWVAARRAAQSVSLACSSQTELHGLVHIFRRLRPVIFGGRNRCVLDCLGMFEFLALNGADISRMRWVVGVRARPWAAHSWLQEHNMVINDTCERVLQYVPILIA